MFNQHPLASPRAAPTGVIMVGVVPQCGKEKSPRPRMLAGQRMDEFTVKVNWRSPRGVDHFHPANNTLGGNQDFADADRAKGAIFDPRTYQNLIAASRGTPANTFFQAAVRCSETLL